MFLMSTHKTAILKQRYAYVTSSTIKVQSLQLILCQTSKIAKRVKDERRGILFDNNHAY